MAAKSLRDDLTRRHAAIRAPSRADLGLHRWLAALREASEQLRQRERPVRATAALPFRSQAFAHRSPAGAGGRSAGRGLSSRARRLLRRLGALAGDQAVAYEQDWRAFADWCAPRGLTAIPVTPATVAAFLASDPGDPPRAWHRAHARRSGARGPAASGRRLHPPSASCDP